MLFPVPLADPATRQAERHLHDRVVGQVVAAFFAVYRELGGGFLEAVYHRALALEFVQRGLPVDQDVAVSVYYRGTKIGHYKAPFVVGGRLIVDVRAGDRVDPNDERQLRNCIRASACDAGVLLHFGPVATFRHCDREVAMAPLPWAGTRPAQA